MTRLAVAIIGDDLTGTLDAAAPFAARGFSTAIAMAPEDAPAALATGATVVAVNSVSRAMDADGAALAVRRAADVLAAANPAIAFKKIDSRLKGNLATETAAALDGFRRLRGIVCPAIPEFGRIVEHGRLQGFGVDEPIVVACRFGMVAGRLSAPDASRPAHLDAIAALLHGEAESHLAIGARGLADALAARLAGNQPILPRSAPLARPMLFAIASRDPITIGQVERLRGRLSPGAERAAPNGDVAPARLPADMEIGLALATMGDGEASAESVAERFATGVAALVMGREIGTLVLCGGETAFAVLRRLGITVLGVGGEAAAGIPWCHATVDGRAMAILTKSGGFGGPDELVKLTNIADKRDSAVTMAGDDRLRANGTAGG
ncbi:four-carbon acid sugar kinase family protein [Kaistia dalseonensis]|uniref:Uncharacterized protein YgbK (DUF1537 family) n=1 Tax=Kaistia dalseonensis TaxID=410840 RepID=A0ABU0HAJ7_9HYPH|nr:four-carbon acid sugar kinase family protein [Kaistia dalseonensis]MCX5496714.1 four-carbon acid sugar kinase family protein [Kaistia dalseonensis]MDQ0439340.1 uncharacterized protein YgbK (DUF1537 family) [Kaistia dalseonensis]